MLVNKSSAFSGDIFINNIPGVTAKVDIVCPQTDNQKINRTLKNFISRQVKDFKTHALVLQSGGYTGNQVFSLSIDCKLVNNTGSLYTVLCDTANSLWNNNQTQVAAFNFYKKTGKLIKISDLLTRGQLKRISGNLFNYFVNELQVIENKDKQYLRKGVQPLWDKYTNFTIHIDQKPALILYFPWSQLISWANGTNWVKISYPEGRIIR